MSSTPTIACSNGAATVSPTTLGFAAGEDALTAMDGGTTSGCSLTGSVNSAIAPPIVMNAEMTAAKIGRSMKKCDSFTQNLLVGRRSVARTRGDGRGVQRQLVGMARGGRAGRRAGVRGQSRVARE